MLNEALEGASDGRPGLKWADRTRDITYSEFNEDGSPSNVFWSVETTMVHTAIFTLVCTLSAVYIDMILPNGYGKTRSPWFFLRCFSRRAQGAAERKFTNLRDVIDTAECGDDPDVIAEAARVKKGETNGRDIAIELVGLSKLFHGGDLKAVDGISYGVDNNSLFVFV